MSGSASARLLKLFEGHRLTPTQRRIAHCLVRHAADAPFLSSVELAGLAGVSQPSVTRFAVALGFDGYPALRRSLRDTVPGGAGPDGETGTPSRADRATQTHPTGHTDHTNHTNPDDQTGQPDQPDQPDRPDQTDRADRCAGGAPRPGSPAPASPASSPAADGRERPGSTPSAEAPTDCGHPNADERPPGGGHPGNGGHPGDGGRPSAAGADRGGAGTPANAYQQAVRAEIDNLRHLSALLADPEPLERAGRLLADSSPLPVLGLRAAAAQARDFAYFAAKVHPDVRLLDEGGSMLTDRTDAAVNAGASALLCFALPRHPRETVHTLSHARQAGLRVVTIADSAFAPVAHPDDLVLPGAVGTELVFDTASAPMLLGRALLESMCDCLPEAQSRLERFDGRAAERGLFVE